MPLANSMSFEQVTKHTDLMYKMEMVLERIITFHVIKVPKQYIEHNRFSFETS